MNDKQIEGKKGEIEAIEYLKNLGYQIVGHNFRCRQGEIDIIARDKEELVFVEVKTRTSFQYGEAREAVNKEKQNHIKRAASVYLYQNHKESEKVRMDVIEIYFIKNKKIVYHLKQAIEE